MISALRAAAAFARRSARQADLVNMLSVTQKLTSELSAAPLAGERALAAPA